MVELEDTVDELDDEDDDEELDKWINGVSASEEGKDLRGRQS